MEEMSTIRNKKIFSNRSGVKRSVYKRKKGQGKGVLKWGWVVCAFGNHSPLSY